MLNGNFCIPLSTFITELVGNMTDDDWKEFTMETITYMRKQAEKARNNYELAKMRKGVTQKELTDLQSKVRYYETAVKALEEVGKDEDYV